MNESYKSDLLQVTVKADLKRVMDLNHQFFSWFITNIEFSNAVVSACYLYLNYE